MKKRQCGYSMGEILVALGILGIIAAMLVPKLLGQRTLALRDTSFKEMVNILSRLTDEGVSRDELFPESSWTYFSTRINATQICNTNAQTEGCWRQAAFAEAGQPGLVLANGATLMGLDNNAAENGNATPDIWGDEAILDWNGATGPNQEGQDQMKVILSFGRRPYQGVAAGSVKPDPTRPQSVALFNQVFGIN